MEHSRNRIAELIHQFREQYGSELQAQAERLDSLEGSVQQARAQHQQLEESFLEQLEILEKLADSRGLGPAAAPSSYPATASGRAAGLAHSGQPNLSETDRKVLHDAERFARLLVSEIELYHHSQVTDGRQHRDLYRRLKSAIDSSRQAYEKRFGGTVARRFNYFHEELVKTLAGSDPSLLGADYPGPPA